MKLGCTKTILILLITLFPLVGFSQNLTGIWRGYFITNDGENYKLEFQIRQFASHAVTGISYSYLDVRFYGKANLTGRYNSREKTLTIQETRTTEVRSLQGGGTCLMNYKLSYVKSGNEEFLEGPYVGRTEDRQKPENNGPWGSCGAGTVQLRRVLTSDFRVEPFIHEPSKQPAHKPQPKPPAKKPQQKPADKKTATTKPPVEKNEAPPDTTSKTIVAPATPKKAIPPPVIIPEFTRSRKNELVQTFTVTNEEILIRIYDNGEIDDDTISLYLDNKPLLLNKRLSAQPISYTLRLNDDSPEHTLVLVAENMGRIPPNTSLMMVYDGEKRYQVNITSTEQKNAMIWFRYEKQKHP